MSLSPTDTPPLIDNDAINLALKDFQDGMNGDNIIKILAPLPMHFFRDFSVFTALFCSYINNGEYENALNMQKKGARFFHGSRPYHQLVASQLYAIDKEKLEKDEVRMRINDASFSHYCAYFRTMDDYDAMQDCDNNILQLLKMLSHRYAYHRALYLLPKDEALMASDNLSFHAIKASLYAHIRCYEAAAYHYKCYIDKANQTDAYKTMEYIKMRYLRCVCLLQGGNFTDGWKAGDILSRSAVLHFAKNTILKNDLKKQDLIPHQKMHKIIIFGSFGYGDWIFMARFFNRLKNYTQHLTLICPAPMVPLLEKHPAVDEILDIDTASPPPHDKSIHMLQILSLFQVNYYNMPEIYPHLRPIFRHDIDRENMEKFKKKMAAYAKGYKLKVGLAWAVSADRNADQARNYPPILLHKFKGAPKDIHFFSLQVDGGDKVVEELKKDGFENITNIAAEMDNFLTSAYIVQNLDLIITIDTATAHLGAALGVPTWVIAAYSQPWYWQGGNVTSPWYLTSRLFRRRIDRDWDEVIDRVINRLAIRPLEPLRVDMRAACPFLLPPSE